MSTATELLRRAAISLEAWNISLSNDIRAFLAAEPEAEPVAWTSDFELKEVASNGYGYFSEPGDPRNNIPLYLHPPRPSPSRKTMTEREIMDLAKSLGFDDITTMDFAIGFRYAEKHHGIGGSDE